MAIPTDVAGAISPEPSTLRRRVPAAADACSTSDSPSSDDSGADSIDRDDRRGDAKTSASERAEGKRTEVPVQNLYRASAPAHRRVKESPLSSDAIFKQSHAGLLNLCIVVLVAVNSRLIIENLMKYGLLIRTGFWFSSKSLRDWPLFMCCLTLPAFPLGAFMVEKYAERKYISEALVIFFHILLTTTAILYPVVVILRCDSAVMSGLTLMLFASIVWLKLVSYAHTNCDLRSLSKLANKVFQDGTAHYDAARSFLLHCTREWTLKNNVSLDYPFSKKESFGILLVPSYGVFMKILVL